VVKMCKNCDKNPVYITLNHRKLCKNCFVKYFEKKVLKTIRKYDMVGKKDKIVVGISGGKDSITTAHILNKFLERRGKKLIALCVDEGIPGYREKTIKDAEKFCKEEGIELNVVSFKDAFGFSLKEGVKKLGMNPCTVCGTLRRYLINKESRRLKATRLATGHNLDDESQTVLMNQFKGNMQFSAKLGPVTGVLSHKGFIRRIKPLYFMTEKEVGIYSFVKGFSVRYGGCPYSGDCFRGFVGDMLNDMENKFAGTKNGLINAFLDVMPELRKKFQGKGIGTCKTCGEPAAKDVCGMCLLLEKMRKN